MSVKRCEEQYEYHVSVVNMKVEPPAGSLSTETGNDEKQPVGLSPKVKKIREA